MSDEVHVGIGPQGKLMVIRRPGERYCHDCIQEAREPDESKKKKLHYWAAVGYDLERYEIPSNKNGKMTLAVYRDGILEHKW